MTKQIYHTRAGKIEFYPTKDKVRESKHSVLIVDKLAAMTEETFTKGIKALLSARPQPKP